MFNLALNPPFYQTAVVCSILYFPRWINSIFTCIKQYQLIIDKILIMRKSLTYHLVLWILKLKGVKKIFNQSPLDYLRLRKDDVLMPQNRFLRKNISRKFTISDSDVTEIAQPNGSEKLLIYVHGGAFVCGPAQHHWDTIAKISKNTDYNIWMCVYPKAPEHNITSINASIDQVYGQVLKEYKSQNIVLIGDSAGATLILTLAQRLIRDQNPLPKKIILISPVLDASMQNPDIKSIEPFDPMLGIKGVLGAKQMAADQLALNDPAISPIYGKFNDFPETILFAGEYDITYPDQIRLEQILRVHFIISF